MFHQSEFWLIRPNSHLDNFPPDGANQVLQTLSDADVSAAAHVSAYGNDLTQRIHDYFFVFIQMVEISVGDYMN